MGTFFWDVLTNLFVMFGDVLTNLETFRLGEVLTCTQSWIVSCCLCVCVRACMRARVRACAHMGVCVCVRACVRVCVTLSCLFLASLWSPVWKGLTSWLSCM